jgi:hypothetical protein
LPVRRKRSSEEGLIRNQSEAQLQALLWHPPMPPQRSERRSHVNTLEFLEPVSMVDTTFFWDYCTSACAASECGGSCEVSLDACGWGLDTHEKRGGTWCVQLCGGTAICKKPPDFNFSAWVLIGSSYARPPKDSRDRTQLYRLRCVLRKNRSEKIHNHTNGTIKVPVFRERRAGFIF